MNITSREFGLTRDGARVTCYRLAQENGSYVEVLDYGCTLYKICVPDRSGALVDVLLGYDTLREYEDGTAYIGATPGRVANRIGGAAFTHNGITYSLTKNEGENQLHGGLHGFSSRVWCAEILDDALALKLCSADGEEGYPGNLTVTAYLQWSLDAALTLRFTATSDAPTPINLTNHAYFNLDGAGDILSHTLQISADSVTETDDALIPTGVFLPIAGTALDFNEPKPIGRDIGADMTALKQGGGYDINYVLRGEAPQAVLYSQHSGIRMTLSTDQPGVQLYSGNFLPLSAGKNGAQYQPHSGVCLEAQDFPDAVNHPHFPSTLLTPDATYQRYITFRFSHDA